MLAQDLGVVGGPSRPGFGGSFGVEVVEFSRAAQDLVEGVLRLMDENGGSVSLDPNLRSPCSSEQATSD